MNACLIVGRKSTICEEKQHELWTRPNEQFFLFTVPDWRFHTVIRVENVSASVDISSAGTGQREPTPCQGDFRYNSMYSHESYPTKHGYSQTELQSQPTRRLTPALQRPARSAPEQRNSRRRSQNRALTVNNSPNTDIRPRSHILSPVGVILKAAAQTAYMLTCCRINTTILMQPILGLFQ